MMDPNVGKKVCYVQFPQRFDGIDRNDRYANHNTVFFDVSTAANFVTQNHHSILKHVEGCTLSVLAPRTYLRIKKLLDCRRECEALSTGKLSLVDTAM
jgi:hypothetical protein